MRGIRGTLELLKKRWWLVVAGVVLLALTLFVLAADIPALLPFAYSEF